MSKEIVIQQKTTTMRSLLEKHKDQFAVALPKNLPVDRLLRIVMTEVRKNPDLLDCTQASLLGAIIQTAQLGLEPGSHLGHAYLVPFNNKKAGIREVQLIVGYKGMINLAYRSPLVDKVVARAVYDTDKFAYQYGLDEKLEHVPDPLAAGDRLTHVYIVVTLKSGGKLFDVMTEREVEAARKRSPSGDSGPWKTDYEAMAMKSVVRKFSKYTPLSIEMQLAANYDDAGDRGDQNNADIITATGITLPDDAPPPLSKAEQLKADLRGEDTSSGGPVFNPDQPRTIVIPADRQPMTTEPTPTFGMSDPDAGDASEPDEDPEALVDGIFELADKLGMTINSLTARCKKDFKTSPRELNTQQLKTLHAALTAEAAKKAKNS